MPQARRHEGLERVVREADLLGESTLRAQTPRAHIALAYDSSGRLYSHGQDNALRCVSVREQLLDDGLPQEEVEASETSNSAWSAYPEPPLPCAAQQLLVNRSGTYALVYAHAEQEDGFPALHIISLTDGRDGANDAIILNDPSLVERPGLQILQAAWHPGSDVHFAVLASDNSFRLYHIDDVSAPEQQVELRLRERQPLGLLDMEGSQAVSFAFGSLTLWERFAVFFTCSNGKLFVLTPLIPFGAAVPASALHQLHAACDAMSGTPARTCTRTWLQQSFPGLGRSGSGTLDSITCQPAALDEHVPALAGPLPISAAGGARHTSLLDFLPDDDDTVVTGIHLGCSVGCLAVGTVRGGLGLLALTGAVQPAWAPQPPQCALRGDAIVRTRMQCTRDADAAPHLLLIDIVQLDTFTSAQPSQSSVARQPPLQLLPVPSVSESLYAVQQSGVVQIKLPWLPRIAALAAGVLSARDSRAELPATSLQEVYSASTSVAGAVVVGDALLGSFLLVADASGGVQCFGGAQSSSDLLLRKPSESAASSPQAASDDSADVEAMVAERFEQLLGGPRQVELPAAPGARCGTPEGRRLLNASIAALRESHIEFAHSAYHELLQHMERLQKNAADQAAQLARLQAQAEQLQQEASRRQSQLQRASATHEDLRSRFMELAAMHARLRQPLSSAEAAFGSRELPALERIALELRRECQVAEARADALATQQEGGVRHAAGAAALPPAQVRKVREALGEQASVLALSRAKVEAATVALGEGF